MGELQVSLDFVCTLSLAPWNWLKNCKIKAKMLKQLTWVHPHLIGQHAGAKSDKSKTCPTGSQPSHKVLIFQFHHICRADWFIRSPLPTLLMVDYHHDVVTNFTSLCAKDRDTTMLYDLSLISKKKKKNTTWCSSWCWNQTIRGRKIGGSRRNAFQVGSQRKWWWWWWWLDSRFPSDLKTASGTGNQTMWIWWLWCRCW